MASSSAATPSRLVRTWRVVHRVAYAIWLCLLAVRLAILLALICLLILDAIISHAHAQSAVGSVEALRAKRQASLDDLLDGARADDVAFYRQSCAAGRRPAGVIRARAIGAIATPDAVELCVTALIRTARDGDLSAMRNPDGSVTPALALDSGFVAGYGKGGSASAMPTPDALRSTAATCLAQTQPDKDLCYSIGYAYGVRAANGETMQAR